MRKLLVAALALVALVASAQGMATASVIFSDNFNDGNDDGWVRSDAAPFYSVVDGEYVIDNYGGGRTFTMRPDITLPYKWTYETDVRVDREFMNVQFGGLALVADSLYPYDNYITIAAVLHDTLDLIGLQIHWKTGANSIDWAPYTPGTPAHLTISRMEGSNSVQALVTNPDGAVYATTFDLTDLTSKLAACKIPGIMVYAQSKYYLDNVVVSSSPQLTDRYLSLNGTTGIFKYASGFGDDTSIQTHTSIDFSSALVDNPDKYLSDAYMASKWHRNGPMIGAFSATASNALVYKISMPDNGALGYKITGGSIHFSTHIYQASAQVSLYVSKDGVNWSPSLQTDQNSVDGWVDLDHDVTIPSAYTGGDFIYVKFTGNCTSANDWASIDNWGISLSLENYTQQFASIADLYSVADGAFISLTNPTVVTVPSGKLSDGASYIEDVDRTCGIKITGSLGTLASGDRALIIGTMATEPNGERVISNAILGSKVVGTPLEPLGMNNKALGGGPSGLKPGITDASGINNIGLLVKVYGRVSNSGTNDFYLDDGSGVSLRVVVPTGAVVPGSGLYVAVTGISSCDKSGSTYTRLVKALRWWVPEQSGFAFSTFNGGKQVWIRSSKYAECSPEGKYAANDDLANSASLSGVAYHFPDAYGQGVENAIWWAEYAIAQADAPFGLSGYWKCYARASQSALNAIDSDWLIARGDPSDTSYPDIGTPAAVSSRFLNDVGTIPGFYGYNFGWWDSSPGDSTTKQFVVGEDGKVLFRIYEREAAPTNALIDMICWVWRSDTDPNATVGYTPTDADLMSLSGW